MSEQFVIRSVRDIEEIEKTPYQERLKADNTYAAIACGASLNPDAPAISFMLNGDAYDQPMVIPYKELIRKIRQSANLFHDLGVGPTDVVTYLLPNIPQTHYILWGAEAAGIVNPINPLLEPATIADICRAAKTKVLVALGEVPGSEIWAKAMAVRSEIPTLEHVVRVFGPSDPEQGIIGFDETVEKYSGDKLDFERVIDPDDISSLYHTGGTTGTPKLARRTHFNEVIMALDLQIMGNMSQESIFMCGLPLFHVNGTTVTGLGPFAVGGHVVMLSPMGYRDPAVIKNFFKIVEHYKAQAFSSVPTVLSTLLDMPVGETDISSLQYAICGAAPLSVEMFKRFEAHTGMKILEGYGLTEGACASSINPKDGERKVGSIGIRMPYQRMKVVILDESGSYERDAEIGEIGAVCIQGPNVFKGYVEEAHNKGIWVQGDWFNSGDLGRMDEDGFFWLTGRKKELIIRGGHNIDPGMIEEVLYKLPDVAVAAAVGRPDPHAGEVPVAFVQLVEGSQMTPDDLLAYAKENVGERAAVPKAIHIIDTIPLTPVGKIFKPALRWQVIQRVFVKELESLGAMASAIDVTVGEDKIHGTSVNIRATCAEGSTPELLEEKIKAILAQYTVHYSVAAE
ncbi:MAG: acyl-CoA synthetase [Desulfobacterales bacterium]|nr:acyl-CoA synthetase [Desulfobacterales bacterium]